MNVIGKPKLSLPRRDHKPAAEFAFNWVTGRRAPRHKYRDLKTALAERDRLRAMGLDAHTFKAFRVENES